MPGTSGSTSACRSSGCSSTTASSTSTGCARCSRAKHPETAPAHRFLLFHVNFGVREEYEESHIPGALYLDTNWLENPVDWNRRRRPSSRRPCSVTMRMGWPRVAVYDGGWFEWSKDPDQNPIEVGRAEEIAA